MPCEKPKHELNGSDKIHNNDHTGNKLESHFTFEQTSLSAQASITFNPGEMFGFTQSKSCKLIIYMIK